MIALLQSDDDISQELHLTVMKKSITYSGVHYYYFFSEALTLENKMKVTAL